MAKKKEKNPAAVALANTRWRDKTDEEKLAFGRKLTRERLKLQKSRMKKAKKK